MLQRLVQLSRRRPGLFFALALIAAGVPALLHLGWVSYAAEHVEPGRGAAWIWAQGAARAAEPVSFWAVKDFTVDDPGALSDASVVIAADEGYVLWVNGRRVGAGAYRQGGPAQRFPVAGLLEAGVNRILVEARSGRGAGGLVATLRAGEPERIVLGTDGSWRILRRARPQVQAGFFLDGDGEAPRIWKHSTTGRFRIDGIEEGTVLERSALPPREPAIRPRRLRYLSDETWISLEGRRGRIPARQTVFDFGTEVAGYLHLDFAQEAKTGLLYFATDLPASPQDERPDVVISPLENRREWRAVEARRFRYLVTVGLPALEGIRVIPASAPPAEKPAPIRGVFGLPPAKSYSAAEEAVWDRLRQDRETPISGKSPAS